MLAGEVIFLEAFTDARQDDSVTEMMDEDIIEQIRHKYKEKDAKLGDIVTMQCILCIILAIAFVLANILLPKVSDAIMEKYHVESAADSAISGALVAAVASISDLLGATPIDANDRA